MMIVFIIPPPEIKRVVSTTSVFQRTGVDTLQVSANHRQNFALYEQLTAENGLRNPRRSKVVRGIYNLNRERLSESKLGIMLRIEP